MSGYSLRLSGTFNFLDLHFSPLTVASTRKSVIIALKFLNFGLTTAKRTSYKLARQLSFVKARLHRIVSSLLLGKNFMVEYRMNDYFFAILIRLSV